MGHSSSGRKCSSTRQVDEVVECSGQAVNEAKARVHSIYSFATCAHVCGGRAGLPAYGSAQHRSKSGSFVAVLQRKDGRPVHRRFEIAATLWSCQQLLVVLLHVLVLLHTCRAALLSPAMVLRMSCIGDSRPDRNVPLSNGMREINKWAEQGRVPKAHEILQRIKASTHPRQKRMLWNTAIKACMRSGEYDVAERYHDAMIREGVKPSKRTYGKLMHCALRSERFDSVDRWINIMEKQNLQPEPLHLNAALVAAVRRDDTVAIERWLKQFQSLHLQPDGYSISALMDAAIKSGNTSLAKDLFEQGMLGGQ